MTRCIRRGLFLLAACCAGLSPAGAGARSPAPVTEAEMVASLESLSEEEMVSELEHRGLGFAADDDTLGRLEEAGVPGGVIAAVRGADPYWRQFPYHWRYHGHHHYRHHHHHREHHRRPEICPEHWRHQIPRHLRPGPAPGPHGGRPVPRGRRT